MKKHYLAMCAMVLLAAAFAAQVLAEPIDPQPDERFGMFYNQRLKPFYHGVASGDPLADRVIIWTRVTPENQGPVEVSWKVATDPYLVNGVQSGLFTTTADRDYTVKVDVAELEPGITYYYGFSALGANSLIGRTKTTPADDVDRVRLGVVTGSNYQWGVFNGYANMARRNDLDAFIHTGDYLYEHASGHYAHPDRVNRDHFPDKELLAIDDYRNRFAQYRLDGDLQRLHQQLPVIAQWDDHEHANDCWVGGAENHDPTTEGDWEARLAASIQAYSEWMPVRMDGPADRDIYRTISYGNLLDLFMTESRIVGRDEQLRPKGATGEIDEEELYATDRTLLGQEQFNWLVGGVTGSAARWKIVGTSVMMSQLYMTDPYGNMDSWDGYPVERDTLFGAVAGSGVTNFGAISGDYHTAFASHLVPLSSYPEYADTGEGAVGFEFTTPSVTSANFNEQEAFPLPDGTVINPLAMGLPERDPITLGLERAAGLFNPHMKYINIDQHGYMLVDFSPEKVQAEWYYTDSLLYLSDNESLGAAWYVEDGSTALLPTDTAMEEKEPALPAPVKPPPASIQLSRLGTYSTGIFDEGAAEIVAHDPVSQQLFVVNGNDNAIDVLDISDPESITKSEMIDLSPYGAAPNSVAVKNGVVAVAVEADPKQDPGQVVFFDTDGMFLNQVTVGALPDMVTFTPDGRKVLVANEGEPNDSYDNDPEGSVTIIDIAGGLSRPRVRTAGFDRFNDAIEDLRAAGVRIYGPNASVAQDLEPEYIAVSPDSRTAWVTLQENNAMAELDLRRAQITRIVPLGYKDHGMPGNGIDPSNKDDSTNIATYANLFGMYQPDAVASFVVDGENYIITANEGDAREYDGFDEEKKVSNLDLDPTAFPNGDDLKDKKLLGNLKVTTEMGDSDNDGDYDALYAYGARSFSIWKQDGDDFEQVFDSADALEQITAAVFPADFNANNDENDSFESRSDNKGPEPEGVTTGIIKGRHFAFIGLERIGGIMVYDVTEPAAPVFVQYINNRDFSGDAEAGTAGDLGPEGLTFIPALDSPTGSPMLAVANEVSGTTTLFEIDTALLPDLDPGDLNNDGVVDREDLAIIRTYLRQPASVFPECDIDGDGTITVLDARKVIRMCTCPSCHCP